MVHDHNHYNWQSSTYHKRAYLKNTYHNESYIFHNSIFHTFQCCSGNFNGNGSKVFERVPSLSDVLSTYSWNFLHYHHRCSICILTLICSLKVKSDSKCTIWSNKFWREICDDCNLYLHMLFAVYVTLSCHRRHQVQCPNIGSSARKKLEILGVYHTVFDSLFWE